MARCSIDVCLVHYPLAHHPRGAVFFRVYGQPHDRLYSLPGNVLFRVGSAKKKLRGQKIEPRMYCRIHFFREREQCTHIYIKHASTISQEHARTKNEPLDLCRPCTPTASSIFDGVWAGTEIDIPCLSLYRKSRLYHITSHGKESSSQELVQIVTNDLPLVAQS